VGSNLYAHILRGRLMRVVPRANEAINETWISDRDRYGYQGVYADDRLEAPLLREGDNWREVSWEIALEQAVAALRAAGPELATLAAPSSTLEELYLLQKLVRGIGARDLDHRVRMQDFRDQAQDPLFPSLGFPIAEIESQDAVLVIGSSLRREAPILAHRLRKAARRGTKVAFVNPARFEYLFPVAHYLDVPASELARTLAALVRAASEHVHLEPPANVRSLCGSARVDDRTRALAIALCSAGRSAVLLGALASRHPGYADLRALAAALALITNSTLGTVSEGANAAGAYLAGVIPHRGPAGRALDSPGRDVAQMLAQSRKAYLLLNLEAEADFVDSTQALASLQRAEQVVMLTPYASEAARRYARLLLPVGTFAETSGTYVNAEGRWQSFPAVANPLGSARPAWKVLRMLGSMLGLAGFEQATSEEIREELRSQVGVTRPGAIQPGSRVLEAGTYVGSVVDLPMYAIDAVVRRAPALQATRDGRAVAARY